MDGASVGTKAQGGIKVKQANGAQDKHRRTKRAIIHDGSISR